MNRQRPPKKKLRDNLNTAARLSGAGIQMGLVIYLAVQGGKWLDGHFGTQKVFLPLCTVLGVGISIYLVVQQLKKIKQ